MIAQNAGNQPDGVTVSEKFCCKLKVFNRLAWILQQHKYN